jgi:Universal stress protein family
MPPMEAAMIDWLVLGSVAERVARRCPCPVVIVHDRQELERENEAEEIAQYR